jgi:uncharacterized protein
MSEMTTYEPGTPCWVELAGIPDFDAAEAFYRDLLGWQIPEQPDSVQLGGYRRAQRDGKDVAGASPVMQGGQPCEWNVYISVADADETMEKIRAAGGTVVVEPLDVMGMGKMALFVDPTGASCGVWEPGTFVGSAIANQPGAFAWNELNTRDPEKAKEFYGAVFGWQANEMKMERPGGDGPGVYVEFKRESDGGSIAGMMDMTGVMPDQIPPHWLNYFAVEDADAAVATVEGAGGEVRFGPVDIPAGRFAVVSQPAAPSAVFAVIQLPS